MTSGSQESDFGSDAETRTTRAAIPETLVAGAVSDRCVSCGSPLTSDQRYCVVCGERRGAPRFSLAASTTEPAAAASSPAAVAAPVRGGRFSAGTTLVAGVATLLLAMLVGVLIGHDTASQGSRTVAAAPVRIITTGGSAGSTSGSGSAATTPSTAAKRASTSTKKASAAKSKAKTTPAVAKKSSAAESGAAKKVLGGSGTPPATVTVGATGTGKGYSKRTHKFTGSFFGQ